MSDIQYVSREVCVDGSSFSEKSDVSNTFGYQLGRFPENGLSFLGNHQDGEDPNDPLYYNWADIDNYEDADDMYRSSDSTCRLGTRHGDGDGLGWFTMSDAIGGSEDALGVPCSDSRSRRRRNNDTSRLDRMADSSSESDLEESSATYKGRSLNSIKYGEPSQLDSSAIKGSYFSSQPGLLSFSTNSSCHDGGKYIPKTQIDDQNKNFKRRKQSGKSRNHLHENESFVYIEDISKSGQQPAEAHYKPFGYMQGDKRSSCDTSLHQHATAIQSENISLTSLSLDDLYESDGVQFMKGSAESLLQETSSASGDTKDQMYQHTGFKDCSNDYPKGSNLAFQMCMFGTISKEEQVNSTETNEFNGDINVRISAKSDGSCEQEKSDSLEVDDISLGATSFRHLQFVMSQLDPRTKLCIRDSLYRLAWSAEQRNYYETLEGGLIDDRVSMWAEGRNMNMEMETDTNPIDRSIAHLLFHRPADHSVLAG